MILRRMRVMLDVLHDEVRLKQLAALRLCVVERALAGCPCIVCPERLRVQSVQAEFPGGAPVKSQVKATLGDDFGAAWIGRAATAQPAGPPAVPSGGPSGDHGNDHDRRPVNDAATRIYCTSLRQGF
jgi:hypothetical protein